MSPVELEELPETSTDEAAAVDPVPEARVRRCKWCLGTVPPPRRKYCRAYCARQGKNRLQTFRRNKARG